MDVETDDAERDVLRLLGRVTASVAHDLNNYLGALNAVLGLLEQTPGDLELVAQAQSAVDRAMRLSASLVGYVRGESPAFVDVELGALVRETLRVAQCAFPATIAVRVEIANQLGVIRGVPSELEQLVLNLVVNAADAMPEGGELTVRVRPAGTAALYLEVADTGAGILVENLGGSTKPGRRAGLGLGIVHRVVDHHDGSIAISRRDHGRGTIVSVFLPTTTQ